MNISIMLLGCLCLITLLASTAVQATPSASRECRLYVHNAGPNSFWVSGASVTVYVGLQAALHVVHEAIGSICGRIPR